MKCEIWLIVDADENWWVSDTDEGVLENYTKDDGVVPARMVKLVINCQAPKAQEVFATLPNEHSDVVSISINEPGCDPFAMTDLDKTISYANPGLPRNPKEIDE